MNFVNKQILLKRYFLLRSSSLRKINAIFESWRFWRNFSNTLEFDWSGIYYLNLYFLIKYFKQIFKSYWGWGGEDDDLAVRIRYARLNIHRPTAQIARFKMMRHKQQKLNDNRHKQLTKARLLRNKDGLNSVSYKVVEFKLYTSFTYILVDVGKK